MYRILLICIVNLWLFIMLASPVSARDYLLLSAPPSIWVQEDAGRLTGPLIGLLDAVFSKLDVSMRSEVLPWARAISHMESGELDMIPVIFYTEDRTKYMEFSEPYTSVCTSIFTPHDRTFFFESIDDLVGKKGLMMRGDSISPEFESKKHKLDLIEVPSYDQIIKMLAARRADYAVAAQYGFTVQMKKMNREEDISMLTPPVAKRKLYLAFSKKSRYLKWLPKINEQLQLMKKDGRLDEMIQKTIEQAAGK